MLGSTRLLFTFLVLFPLSAFAEISSSVIIHSSSNAIYNGLTENNNKPYAAVNAELQLNPNWVFGAQLQDSEPVGIRQRQRVLSSYIGYDYAVNDNWLSSMYVINRKFLASARKWDYDEFSVKISHKNGAALNLTYAPNYYSSSVKGIGSTLSYIHHFTDRYYARTQVGTFNMPSQLNYQFAHLAVGTSVGRFNMEVAYHWTEKQAIQTRMGPIVSPGFVLSVNYLAF